MLDLKVRSGICNGYEVKRSTMILTIRKASKEDSSEIAKVLRTSFKVTYPTFPELHTPEEDRNFIANVVFAKDDVFVAEVEGRIIGFIAFNAEYVDHLYLLPGSQRLGIGRQLLEIAMNAHSQLKLWTFQENTGARAFYEKHGFIATQFTDGAGNEEKQPDVMYQWKRNSTDTAIV